jgi:hypothetical protein
VPVYWWSVEVLDGEFSAESWRLAYGSQLIEAAVSHGAKDWSWAKHHWGVIFEVKFADPEAWSTFRQLPGVVAAFDAVPDPIGGLLIYQGRGGSSNSAKPRRPKPRIGAGGAELPREPEPRLVSRSAEYARPPEVEAAPAR